MVWLNQQLTIIDNNFHRFLDAINSCEELSIHLDISNESLMNIANGCQELGDHNPFTYCCGAVDGLSIKIHCPKKVLIKQHIIIVE